MPSGGVCSRGLWFGGNEVADNLGQVFRRPDNVRVVCYVHYSVGRRRRAVVHKEQVQGRVAMAVTVGSVAVVRLCGLQQCLYDVPAGSPETGLVQGDSPLPGIPYGLFAVSCASLNDAVAGFALENPPSRENGGAVRPSWTLSKRMGGVVHVGTSGKP